MFWARSPAVSEQGALLVHFCWAGPKEDLQHSGGRRREMISSYLEANANVEEKEIVATSPSCHGIAHKWASKNEAGVQHTAQSQSHRMVSSMAFFINPSFRLWNVFCLVRSVEIRSIFTAGQYQHQVPNGSRGMQGRDKCAFVC